MNVPIKQEVNKIVRTNKHEPADQSRADPEGGYSPYNCTAKHSQGGVW